MKTVLKSAALAVAVIGIGSVAAESASAANRLAMTRVENPFTDITITYSFRWGNGPWQSATVMPRQTGWHAWPFNFADENWAPKLYIRFDSDRTGATFLQDYWLKSYSVPDRTSRGKIYRFEFDGPARRFIDLRVVN